MYRVVHTIFIYYSAIKFSSLLLSRGLYPPSFFPLYGTSPPSRGGYVRPLGASARGVYVLLPS
jgi:hypothetical protein